jgi:protein-disulfide isomerase
MKLLVTPFIVCLLLSVSVAQKTRRPAPATRRPEATSQQTQPNSNPEAALPATKPRPPLNPIPIVVVNGQTITTSEFEAALKEQIESVEYRISEEREDTFELQINTLLLKAEARKRGITSERLYEMEVMSKISQPTAAEIKKFIDENPEEFRGADPATVSSQVSNYLFSEREGKVSDQLVQRLKKLYSISRGVDINTPNLKDDAVIAVVAGQPITAAMLNERMKPIIYKHKLTAYEQARKRAEQLVNDQLLLAEATRRQIGPEEIVRKEITEKVAAPSEAEIAKFYEDNKARINGGFQSVRNQIASYLLERARERLENELSARLRKGAEVRWLITEPVAPVQAISTDDDPGRGDVNAPVTVVEFTDFQCPSCAAMHSVLEDVLKPYGNSVRFVVRDFPLSNHENALKAAEAANAAFAQGKFFEYTALLYKRQNALTVPSLKKYASELGLNRTRFDAALDSGTYAAEIKHDIEDGEIYGVGSTPTIFINGVMLRTLSADALREAIDRAAAARRTSAPPQVKP